MKFKLLNFISNDGSRLFAEMPENRSFKDLLYHAGKLDDLFLTEYLTDNVTEVWIDFRFKDHKFSINNQSGEYLFFAADANAPEALLNDLASYFSDYLLKKHRIAFYGGTFDPVHCGHLAIAKALPKIFALDKFYFLPAFHAPHKEDSKPTPEYHRLAMLEIAIGKSDELGISKIEIDHLKKRYTYETLDEIKKLYSNDIIYFVMGADSWQNITKWKEWEKVLSAANHIVVSRPGYDLHNNEITDSIKERIIDLRGSNINGINDILHSNTLDLNKIYFTDVVFNDISATEIRHDASDGVIDNPDNIPSDVAKYIEKYGLYR